VILAYPYNPVFCAQAKLMHVPYGALVHSAKVRLANWGFFWVVSQSLHGLPQYLPPPPCTPNTKPFIVHWLMCYSYLSLGTHEVVPQLRAKIMISHFGGDDRLLAEWLEVKIKSCWKNTCSITINWDSVWASIVRIHSLMHEVSACRQGWNTWLY
jgi:hypothetical protein